MNNNNNNCIGNAFREAMKEIEIKCAEQKAKNDAELKSKQLVHKDILRKKEIFEAKKVEQSLNKCEFTQRLSKLSPQYNGEFKFRVYGWRDSQHRLMLNQFGIYFITLINDKIPVRLVVVINKKDFRELYEIFKVKNLLWFVNAYGRFAEDRETYTLSSVKKSLFNHPFIGSFTSKNHIYDFCPTTKDLLKKYEFDDNYKIIYIKSDLKQVDEAIDPFVLPLPKKEETKKEEPSQKIKGLKTKEFGR